MRMLVHCPAGADEVELLDTTFITLEVLVVDGFAVLVVVDVFTVLVTRVELFEALVETTVLPVLLDWPLAHTS